MLGDEEIAEVLDATLCSDWIITGPKVQRFKHDFGAPGPVFYQAQRVGKDGKPFRLYKFRSTVWLSLYYLLCG